MVATGARASVRRAFYLGGLGPAQALLNAGARTQNNTMNDPFTTYAGLKFALMAVIGCDERQAELWAAEIAVKSDGMVVTTDAPPHARAMLEFFSAETARAQRQ